MSQIDVNRTFQIAGTNGGLVRLVTHFEAAPWLHPVSELGEKADLFEEASGGRLVLQEQMVRPSGGARSSILRATVFHDEMGAPLSEAMFADFGVIWDEDHDERMIEPIEAIYWAADLASFLFFGERKGSFCAVLSDDVRTQERGALLDERVSAVTRALPDDPWPACVIREGTEGSSNMSDDSDKVVYLANLRMLWRLGTKSCARALVLPW